MRETYYRLLIVSDWQFGIGIKLNRHFYGYKCHALQIDLPFLTIVFDISRKVDKFIKFKNYL